MCTLPGRSLLALESRAATYAHSHSASCVLSGHRPRGDLSRCVVNLNLDGPAAPGLILGHSVLLSFPPGSRLLTWTVDLRRLRRSQMDYVFLFILH